MSENRPELNEQPLIAAERLIKKVSGPEGSLTILNDVSVYVHAGEAVAILGASGSGKSTLLGLLAGLDIPSSGDVKLFDTSLSALDEDGRAQLRAGKVGFVFQSFQLLPGLSALENVMLPIELAGEDNPRGNAMQVLEQVGLGERVHHMPNQLSGGEQQRVAIARAFASRPSIMFADEPTGNLDQRTGQRIVELLFSLQSDFGTALVLVTHDPALAARCNRQYTLDAGRIVDN